MGLLTILYLIGSVTFILGLKMLSNPATARKGNLLAAAGMVVAINTLFFLALVATEFVALGIILNVFCSKAVSQHL